MARRPRNVQPDGIFHITARGAGQIHVFRDDDDRRFFLSLLARVIRRYSWRCHAFCLMGNHYHLVVEAERNKLSAECID